MNKQDQSPYHHGDLERALVAAGLQLVDEGGPAALTLRAAARRSGVSHAAPYRHFADREALLAAVAARGFREFRDALLAAAKADSEARGRVQAMGRAYVRFSLDHPGLFRLMFGPELADKTRHAELERGARAAYAVINEAVAAAVPEGIGIDPAVGTMGAWALVHGLAHLFLDGQAPPDATASEEAVTQAVTALFADALSGRLPGGIQDGGTSE